MHVLTIKTKLNQKQKNIRWVYRKVNNGTENKLVINNRVPTPKPTIIDAWLMLKDMMNH